MAVTKVRVVIGRVTSHYELVIKKSPIVPLVECYGVRNLETGVVEAHVAQLAMAIHLMNEMTKDLTQGITRDPSAGSRLEVDDLDEDLDNFTAMFRQVAKKKTTPPSPSKLN